jgi:hypothetical protein
MFQPLGQIVSGTVFPPSLDILGIHLGMNPPAPPPQVIVVPGPPAGYRYPH